MLKALDLSLHRRLNGGLNFPCNARDIMRFPLEIIADPENRVPVGKSKG